MFASALAISAIEAAPPEVIPGEIIVRFRPGITEAQAQQRLSRGRGRALRHVRTAPMARRAQKGLWLASTRQPLEQALAELRNDPAVEHAEANLRYTHQLNSNDSYFTSGSLWGMYGDASTPANGFGSQAAEAWAAGYTGTNQVYVAVIDDGTDISHPDLAGNIWTNPFDADDDVDNDGNGYIDDLHGWDFNAETNVVYKSGEWHGTHVAGTIGAVGGNSAGVAGVCWEVSLVPLKFITGGSGSTLDAIEAIDYCIDLKDRHGLNLVAINASWGSSGYSQLLHDAVIRAAKANILFIAAAGNSTNNNDINATAPANIDTSVGTTTESAASYNSVLSVAAIDQSGAKPEFSNYGASTVHLGAPGASIGSTTPGGAYGWASGTSMAAPHVAGAVALYASTHPSASPDEMRDAILASVLPTPSLDGLTITGGRLNLSTIITPATLDTDGDGLPDAFELLYDLDPNDAADAAADLDGDGLSSLEEYLAGTDPENATSSLRILSTSNEAGGFSVEFNSASGLSYSLEANDNFPSGSWQTLATNLSGTGAALVELDATAGEVSNRIYRVRAGESAQSVLTELAGFQRLTFQGNADTLLSLPFFRPAAALGAVLSSSADTVQFRGSPGWTANEWVYASGTQSNTYFLLIRGGALEGRHFTITGNGSDTLTLDLQGASLDGLAPGDPAAIIPHWTLGSIFPSGEGIHPSASPSSRSTEILFPNVGGSGINLSAVRTYYYFNGAWRQVGLGSAIKNDDVVLPDMYLWVRQNTSTSSTLTTRGSVLPGKWLVGVRRDSASKQDNVLALPRPVAVSLGDSGLVESGGFRASLSPSNRTDELLVFDNAAAVKNKSASATYYYYSGAWRKVGSGGTNMDGVQVFTPGTGILIRAAADPSVTTWTNAAEY